MLCLIVVYNLREFCTKIGFGNALILLLLLLHVLIRGAFHSPGLLLYEHRQWFESENTGALYAYAYVQNPDLYGKLRQFNITVIQISFVLVNTNITVAESRFDLVSRESNVRGVFNLETPFSKDGA